MKKEIRIFYTDMITIDKVGNRKDNLEEKREQYTEEAFEEAEEFIESKGIKYERLCVVFYTDYKKALEEQAKEIYNFLKNNENYDEGWYEIIKQKYGRKTIREVHKR